jgi:hypothetical protein
MEPQDRPGRLLWVEPFHGGLWFSLGLVAFLLVLMYPTLFEGPVRDGPVVFAVSLAAILPPVALFLYPHEAMRGAVWEDGFRPSATRFEAIGVVEWVRRRFNAKIGWGEVRSFFIIRQRGTHDIDEILLFVEGGTRYRIRVARPWRPTEAELALRVLERWMQLGGQVREDDTWW